MDEPVLRHAFRSDEPDVARVEASVARFLELRRVAEKTAYAARVVVEEILTNVLRHGRAEGRSLDVRFEIRVEPDAVVLSFEDDGPEFDPRSAPTGKPTGPLADRSPSGLGLVLVRAITNAIDYRREDGRNLTTIRVSEKWGRRG